MADGPGLSVTVAYSPGPREVREWIVQVPPGACIRDAVAASGLRDEFPAADPVQLHLCVWGRAATPGQRLREGDRIELLRPLRVDPKVARRERFSRQGTRAPGLFARGPRRP